MKHKLAVPTLLIGLTSCGATRAWLDAPAGEETRTEEEIEAGVAPEGATRGDVAGDGLYVVLSILGLGAVGFGAKGVLKTRRKPAA